MTAACGFDDDLENSQDKFSNRVMRINGHGRLVSDAAGQLKDVAKRRIPEGGRILIDLADVQQLDSSGLGTLVGLKVSALKARYCHIQLVNLSPRIADLLRIIELTQLFEG